MSHSAHDVPLGIRIIRKLGSCFCPNFRGSRTFIYRTSILVLTFFTYTAYHMSRKPISVVKNVLSQNCTGLIPPPGTYIDENNKDSWCDWAPFDGKNSQTLLGTLDSAFLFAYAAGMFLSGFVAERVNLRYFLALGMLTSGFFTYLFGVSYSQGIHSLPYFFIVQTIAGFAQSTGWPGVVTAVGNWFGKGKRGLIFGIWNSHTSVGNILGSLIAGHFVESNWGMSFIIPGAIIGFMGFIIFLFLVTDPRSVGCNPPDHHGSRDETIRAGYSSIEDDSSSPGRNRNMRLYANGSTSSSSSSSITLDPERESLLSPTDNSVDSTEVGTPDKVSSEITISSTDILAKAPVSLNNPDFHRREKAIGFVQALRIPGVIEFSLCLFFAKLINYTFLFWLPRYINASTSFDASESADLSTLFDVGGIVGGIIAGVLSDVTGMSAVTCAIMLVVAIPMLFVYQTFGTISLVSNILLLMSVGLLVNGPYALITTAVSTELGTHQSLRGSARALATVTAIIDGTGSIGAAVGPLIAGTVSDYGWDNVFYMLMVADVIALVLLARLVKHEIERFRERRREMRFKRERMA
ncbi:glucose-6-phosphate exchanger SLC37A2-like [Daphnia carinata]|uniref:glucose-6-phosphate exchanger SLC37A2-like n=1 Tax=Daphnia carinata TaxID=120202 RepID=UPI00257A58EB|nr:glucose-6-phosphate exchanger SLC37A2-like [Daphnia carinata]